MICFQFLLLPVNTPIHKLRRVATPVLELPFLPLARLFIADAIACLSKKASTGSNMAYCSRCCLNHAMKAMHLVVNCFGTAMIIYSVWLLKTWKQGVATLDVTTSNLPTPWFIHTMLGIGIMVCFCAIVGHAVISRIVEGHTKFVNSFSFYASICRLVGIVILLAQVNVLVLAIILWALGPQPRNNCESCCT
ncbi:hypothetical protein Cni_G00179 [Canna indica]|uniref:Uncharacterized protein n=1 Tax=Canna indica TaxID=4628 RepID=A0AAQ3JKQ6_9LILI|nr:hypothetical protein Cni_G00179 [Canna indica]